MACNSQGFWTPWWWLRLSGRNMLEWLNNNKLINPKLICAFYWFILFFILTAASSIYINIFQYNLNITSHQVIFYLHWNLISKESLRQTSYYCVLAKCLYCVTQHLLLFVLDLWWRDTASWGWPNVTLLEVPEQIGTVEYHNVYLDGLSFDVSTTYITRKNVFDKCESVLVDAIETYVVVEV